MGLALDLWTWALARAPDDAPPDGIVTGTGPVPDRLLSGSVGWTGPTEQFTDALVACGMAERIESGYRLTGFSRYKATWEKNRRRPGGKPERNRTGTGGKPERKTQTQTQTHIDASPTEETSSVSLAEQFRLEAQEAPAPPASKQPGGRKRKDRTPSGAERLFGRLQELREDRCAEVGEPVVPEVWPFWKQNEKLGPLVKASPEEQGRFEDAYHLYLGEDDERAREPAWSLSYFMSDGVRAKYETRAAREAA